MKMDFESLQQKLAKILEVDPISLDRSSVLRELEQLDSFAMLAAVALVNEHTGKPLNIQDVEKLVSVDDLLELINSQ